MGIKKAINYKLKSALHKCMYQLLKNQKCKNSKVIRVNTICQGLIWQRLPPSTHLVIVKTSALLIFWFETFAR